MDKNKLDAIKLHSAGATVRHTAPFHENVSYKNEIQIDQEFRTNWVIPFYRNLRKLDQNWINTIVKIYPKISDEIILKNLGDFDWRTRSTGEHFCCD